MLEMHCWIAVAVCLFTTQTVMSSGLIARTGIRVPAQKLMKSITQQKTFPSVGQLPTPASLRTPGLGQGLLFDKERKQSNLDQPSLLQPSFRGQVPFQNQPKFGSKIFNDQTALERFGLTGLPDTKGNSVKNLQVENDRDSQGLKWITSTEDFKRGDKRKSANGSEEHLVDLVTTSFSLQEAHDHSAQNVTSSVEPDWTPIKTSKVPIVWLLGRPGTGKGTQAHNIVSHMPGFVHISTGDLLRTEAEKDTPRGKIIADLMKQGGLVPNEIVQELLNIKMLDELPHAKAFLIDGYPREIGQADEFVRDAKAPKRILYLDAPDDVIMHRLNKRGKTSGRSDDNVASVRRRLEQATINDAPILKEYENQISLINTNTSPDAVFPVIREALRDVYVYPHVEFSE